MLEVKSLSAGYSDTHVLEHVDFRIPSGKVTVILGPNGCGKSTLLKALCGIIPADSGQVVLDGENILTLPQRQLAQRVAYLAQSRQIPDITVERLVLHGRFPYLGYPRRYRKEDYAIADAAMKPWVLQSWQMSWCRISPADSGRKFILPWPLLRIRQ